ncbi:MAG: hypothetical protein R6U63_10615 [Longimicrobiales bacterium]
MSRNLFLIAAALVLSAAAALADQTGTFRVHANHTNAMVVSQLRADLVTAERTIHRLLGEFPETVAVHVHSSRDAFTSALHEAWGMEETACWMVGAAGERTLHLLSPDVWAEQASEHDPTDREHVRQLVTHEAVHVLHGQVNPADDLGHLEALGWFIEGLATYASGQLESRHAARAAQAIAAGEAPDRLADAWNGPYRYGVAGSMVAFIDDAWGRDTLRSLLTATSQREILGALGVDEAAFLERWRAWVVS